MTDTPDEIDIAVGKRIRRRRAEIGLTQKQLAAPLGVTMQQVQKYETAKNRASASMLVKMASVLETTVSDLVGETGAAPVADHFMSPRTTSSIVALMSQMTPAERNALRQVALALIERRPSDHDNVERVQRRQDESQFDA